jgi:starch synthase
LVEGEGVAGHYARDGSLTINERERICAPVMRVGLLTREYPPEVYGGAGVHVEYLSRELARQVEVEVRCFGAPRPPTPPGARLRVRAIPIPAPDPAGQPESALRVLSVDLAMAATLESVDLVHSHTWYTNFAGHLAKLLYGVPHVMTSHSLEPLRPWKAEQLGAGGYEISKFCERSGIDSADAVIAVSGAMRADLLATYPQLDPARVAVIHNGIDADQYRPDPGTDVLERWGVDPRHPIVSFVGRITRQKGIVHLVEAGRFIAPEAQLVFLAGSPDEPGIGRETAERIERLRRERAGIVWIDRMAARTEVIQLLSHSTVFVCPSVYEPLGIVNLEAMACGAAVVASAVGGIPEVVEDGVTGLLVPFEPRADGEPTDADGFARDLAERVNALLADPSRAERFGAAGRARVLDRFTWPAVAGRTLELYRRLVAEAPLRT